MIHWVFSWPRISYLSSISHRFLLCTKCVAHSETNLACHVNLLSLKDPHSLFLPENWFLFQFQFRISEMPTLLTRVTMFSVRISGDIILKPIRIMSKDPKDPSPQTSGQVVLPHIIVSSLAGGDYLCQQRPLCLDFVEFTCIWKLLS